MKSRKQTIWMLALALVAVPLAAEAQYTFIDLAPGGFTSSQASGISGSQQAGYGVTNGLYHALLWSGTAASVVDLQSFLSTNYFDSVAYGIDANGNIVGSAYNLSTGQDDAILWVVVPEPSTFALAGLGAVALLGSRRLRRRTSRRSITEFD